MGRFGRKRREWCESYITWRTDHIDKLQEALKNELHARGGHISCSKGCWFCCTQYVHATLQDCEAIVYWLYQHEKVRHEFIKQYPIWRNKVREHETLFQQITNEKFTIISQSQDPSVTAIQKPSAAAYHKLNIKCPFLDDHGECIIYPVRPSACVLHMVLTPPELCKSSSVKEGSLYEPKITPTPPPYFCGPSNLITLLPVPILVFGILRNGFITISKVTGCAGLENEVLGDSEIQAFLQSCGHS